MRRIVFVKPVLLFLLGVIVLVGAILSPAAPHPALTFLYHVLSVAVPMMFAIAWPLGAYRYLVGLMPETSEKDEKKFDKLVIGVLVIFPLLTYAAIHMLTSIGSLIALGLGMAVASVFILACTIYGVVCWRAAKTLMALERLDRGVVVLDEKIAQEQDVETFKLFLNWIIGVQTLRQRFLVVIGEVAPEDEIELDGEMVEDLMPAYGSGS